MSLPRQLRDHRNLLVVVAAQFLTGLETSMVNVVWQPFVLSLGASMSTLGLLSSIGGYNGIVPTLVSPIGGWFADRRGRRLILLGASLCLIVSYVLYSVAGLSGLLLVLGPGILLAGLAGLSRPVWSAVTGESVRSDRQATAYSLVLIATTVPGILAPLGAGWLADQIGRTAIFPLVAAAELVSFVLVARLMREVISSDSSKVEWPAIRQLLRRAWFPPRGLRGLFAISAMDSFSWGMGWGLLYGIFSKELHFDAAQLGVLSSVTSLTWAVIQLPIGRLVDRVGSKRILALSEATGAPLMLIWMTQRQFELLAASMTIFAINAALWIPARNTYVTRAVDSANRAEAFGRLAAFGGLIAFPAPFIGGYLFDHWGYTAPLLANLVGSVITLFVIVVFVHEPRASKV